MRKKKLENSNFHARHRRIFSDRSENFDEWKSSFRTNENALARSTLLCNNKRNVMIALVGEQKDWSGGRALMPLLQIYLPIHWRLTVQILSQTILLTSSQNPIDKITTKKQTNTTAQIWSQSTGPEKIVQRSTSGKNVKRQTNKCASFIRLE